MCIFLYSRASSFTLGPHAIFEYLHEYVLNVSVGTHGCYWNENKNILKFLVNVLFNRIDTLKHNYS